MPISDFRRFDVARLEIALIDNPTSDHERDHQCVTAGEHLASRAIEDLDVGLSLAENVLSHRRRLFRHGVMTDAA